MITTTVMKLTFDKGSRNAKCPNKPHEDRSDSSNDAPTHNFNGYHISVGVTGFEPATSSSRTTRATKLRHTPLEFILLGEFGRQEFSDLSSIERCSFPQIISANK
jgi:hypothetical protein